MNFFDKIIKKWRKNQLSQTFPNFFGVFCQKSKLTFINQKSRSDIFLHIFTYYFGVFFQNQDRLVQAKTSI